MHYRATVASTPRVLMLHQTPSSSRSFAALMHALDRRGVGSLALDRPGFGASDAAPEGWTLRTHAEIALDAAQQLASPPVVIVGHHTGARIAVEAADARPDLVQALVLVGLPYYESEAARSEMLDQLGLVPLVMHRDGSHFLSEWSRLRRLAPDADAELLTEATLDAFVSADYRAAYGQSTQHDIGPLLDRLRVPTWVIDPPGDILSPYQQAASRRIAGARYRSVAGGLLYPQESAEELAGIVIEALDAGS